MTPEETCEVVPMSKQGYSEVANFAFFHISTPKWFLIVLATSLLVNNVTIWFICYLRVDVV